MSISRFRAEVDSYERAFLHPDNIGDVVKYEDHQNIVDEKDLEIKTLSRTIRRLLYEKREMEEELDGN